MTPCTFDRVLMFKMHTEHYKTHQVIYIIIKS